MGDAGEPRWLDADERETWLALVAVLTHLPSALDEQVSREAGISHFEYQLLAVLSEQPEWSMRLSELAELANASLTKLSRAIDRLAARGWVRRESDPTNGRYTLGRLTEAGWQAVVAAAPGHVEEVRRLVFDPLTKAQVRQLREIASRIQRAIGTDAALDRLRPR